MRCAIFKYLRERWYLNDLKELTILSIYNLSLTKVALLSTNLIMACLRVRNSGAMMRILYY